MIDLKRALYSHSECAKAGVGLPVYTELLMDALIREVLGTDAPDRSRMVTYLQGAVDLLDHDNEFRVHIWFNLPDGHPSFPQADRGLLCFVQALDENGVYGAVYGQLGWLGSPVNEAMFLDQEDWIAQMIRDQGYLSIPGAEWTQELHGAMPRQFMAGMLACHLDHMVNHIILEERLYGLSPLD